MIQHIQMMVTERCNLRCKHCAVPTEDSPAEFELSVEEWLDAITEFARRGVQSLVLSGGEAFILRENLVRLASHAHEQGIRQTLIVSNMTMIMDDVARAVANAQQTWGIPSCFGSYDGFGLTMSVDGATEPTHDWMRGHGALKRLLRGHQILKRHGAVVTGMNTVVHQGNYHEIEEIAALGVKLGVRNWRIFPLADIGRGLQRQDVVLTRQQWLSLLLRVPLLMKKYPLDIMTRGPLQNEFDWSEIGVTLNYNARETSTYCVGPDGDMFTCPPLRSESLGNVGAFADNAIWSAAMARGTELTKRHCSTCRFLSLCVGVNPLRPLISLNSAAESATSV